MRILVVNWQDREAPLAGGAEIHLHEIFGRIAAAGHEVTLLCGGWPGCAPRVTLDGIMVHRAGTRYTFPFVAHRYYRAYLARLNFDVLVEDINKVPLHTARWGVRRTVALVPHLFGGTVFREAPFPIAAAVWLAERPLARAYRDVPFEAISESTADDLVARGVPRAAVRVIYPGIDARAYTPDAAARAPEPVFAYLGRLKRYKGVDLVVRAFARVADPRARLEIAGVGDHRAALERLVGSLALGERVRFLGRVSEAEKLALLRRAWALVFASPKEGWGITNLEAAACATPVWRRTRRDCAKASGMARPDSSSRTATLARSPRGSTRSPRRPHSSRRWGRAGDASPNRSRGTAPPNRPPPTSQRSPGRTCDDDSPMVSRARAPFTVARLIDLLTEADAMEQIGAPVGHERPIASAEASSPGLVLAGYVGRFAHERIQVFGETEVTYLASLAPETRATNLERFFSFPIPCVFITKGQEPPEGLLTLAERAGVGVFRTTLKTAEFYDHVKPLLADEFAPTATLHGSLADVYGVGLFFTGMSGIGKSECVLDLVERGHRLVADDLLIVKRRGADVLIGRGHELQRHHMEIRGIGLIDIPAIFGVRAVRQQKRVEVCVHLEPWDQEAVVDRTGLDGETHDILGVALPRIRVPLNPGKNITVIAEVIAMNHLLRYSTGVDPAEAFNQRLIGRMRAQAAARDQAPAPDPASDARAGSTRALELQRYLRDDDE